MSNTRAPDNFPHFDKATNESVEDFFPSWGTLLGAEHRRPKKIPPESLITPEDRDMRGYDLRGDLVLKLELARPFEGRLPMQVPAGCYVCRPVIGQLRKVQEARFQVPYYLLATVVAVGPHEGSIVPWYWPYPCQGDDKFWRDCEAAGIDPNYMDYGCGFTSGALHVVVRKVRKGKDWCREVSSVTKLSSVIPEAIWPTEADKPSVKKARTHAVRSAVAAAASLNAGGAVHEKHENDDNEKVH